jgi:hypothetical protein
MLKKFWKSKINRQLTRHGGHLLMALFLLIFGLSLGKIEDTNSFFTDRETSNGNIMTAGFWIPELTMSVNPENPDGEDGFYKTTPCVTLTADINGETDDITIYYEFSNDGNPVSGGTVYFDTCIDIPDGDPTYFQAQAVNDENPTDWKSNTVSQDFKVSTGPKEGDVVINELMWMGSKCNEDDEWIELRNMTDQDIDLSNWDILNGGNGSGHIEIPHGYSIKANGYFLITKKKWDETEINLSEDLEKDEGYTHVSGMNLKNAGEKLTLQDKERNIMDTAWKDGHRWPAGWHGLLLHMSMERNRTPGDGTNRSSWHTCIDLNCNNTDYWQDEGWNFGTPGKVNLSANDPTDENFDPASLEKKIEDEQETALDPDEEEIAEIPKEEVNNETAPEEAVEDNPEIFDEPVIDEETPAAIEEKPKKEDAKDSSPEETPASAKEELKKEEPQEETPEEEPKKEEESEIISEIFNFEIIQNFLC